MTEVEVAVRAALAAGRILADRDPSGVRHKGTVDLVTEVDLACEQAIRDVLAEHTPDVPVLGEEGGGAEHASTRWVVDPLDGTTNFVHGFPWYCVSVALEIDGRGEVGVIHDPVRGRTYQAARGQGASVDGAPLRVSDTPTLGEALLATGFPYDRRDRLDELLAAVRAALTAGQGLRRAGAAAMDLAMVAAGSLDGYWELNLGRWDAAAGLVLVEEAGGRVSAVPGHALGDRPCPVATNGRIHDALTELLASV